jgi:hypothetical protein
MGGDGRPVPARLLPHLILIVVMEFGGRKKTMFRKHFRFRRRIFVGLAFAALAVPATAQASTGFFVDGGPAPVSLDNRTVAITSEHSYHAITPLQADGLRWQAMARAYQQPTQAVSERSNGVKGPDPSLVPQLVSSTSNSFDWKDAGIGASTAFGVALLLLIAVALGRRNQHAGLTNA